MAAPKGHPLWGNPLNVKKYTPEEFWEGAVGYFNWCIDNPIMVYEQSKMPQRLPANYNKKTHGPIKNFTKQIIEIPRKRAFSVEGLCNYLDIHIQTFLNYESKKGYETYFEVVKRVRQIINTQHFEGGMAGVFHSLIVIRKLGLAERTDISSLGKSLAPKVIVQDSQTAKELNKLYEENDNE